LAETIQAVRRRTLAGVLAEHKLDAFLVSSLPNIRYLSGFTGSNGALLVTPERARLFTDPRYTIQAAEQTDTALTIARGVLWPAVIYTAARLRLRRIAFERGRISFQTHETLKSLLTLGMSLEPAPAWIEEQRMIKSDDEITAIRRSVAVNSAAYHSVLNRIRPGMREFEIAAELEYHMRCAGAEKPAFETIVASGPRTALPHASPTANRVALNQLLLIDMGATCDGYTSDMTRVAAVGKPKPAWRRIYRAVLESQEAAVAAVREGVTCAAVDRTARKTLRAYGLDRAFVHSTGHGLGLEIHELPRIAKSEKTILKAGMVITIEPGAYIEGDCGVRIEDTVLVGKMGCEVLTPTPRDLAAV
jgi:Xaa-Pro aminopeptidase